MGLLDFRRQELSQPAYYLASHLCSAGKLSYFRISVDAFVATLELEFHRFAGGRPEFLGHGSARVAIVEAAVLSAA